MGLTLLELLVVITVIALLVAIVMPSLRASREHANAVICCSNLRQLSIGLLLYASENETFPQAFDDTLQNAPQGGYAGNHSFDRTGWWWFNRTTDCDPQDKKNILWCPARKIRNRNLQMYVLHGNYGVNESVCRNARGKLSQKEFTGTPLRTMDLPHPGETLLIMDCGYSMITWWHVTQEPPVPFGDTIEDAAYVPGMGINREKKLWQGQEGDAIEGRHPNRNVNVGLADGHISKVPADSLMVEKVTDGYRNVNLLWVPKRTQTTE